MSLFLLINVLIEILYEFKFSYSDPYPRIMLELPFEIYLTFRDIKIKKVGTAVYSSIKLIWYNILLPLNRTSINLHLLQLSMLPSMLATYNR